VVALEQAELWSRRETFRRLTNGGVGGSDVGYRARLEKRTWGKVPLTKTPFSPCSVFSFFHLSTSSHLTASTPLHSPSLFTSSHLAASTSLWLTTHHSPLSLITHHCSLSGSSLPHHCPRLWFASPRSGTKTTTSASTEVVFKKEG